MVESLRPLFLLAEAVSVPNADLSDAFHHARERWHHGRSSSGKSTITVPYSTDNDRKSSQATRDGSEEELSLELHIPIVEKDPPQLAPLPDMSECSLERSSTLRACIERASDDFVVKYKSQRRPSKAKMHHNLPDRPKTYTARPKAIPLTTLRPLERKKRIKGRPLPTRDTGTCFKNIKPAAPLALSSRERCRSLPGDELQCASGRSVIVGSDIKQVSEKNSPSRSTSIATLRLPPNVFEGSPLSEQRAHSLGFTAIQSVPNPAVRLQLSNRFLSQDSNTTFPNIGLSLC